MNARHDRPWFLKGRYPGLEPFAFGTVFAPTEETALAAALALWSRLFPFAPPDGRNIRMVPGSVPVVPEGERDASSFERTTHGLVRAGDAAEKPIGKLRDAPPYRAWRLNPRASDAWGICGAGGWNCYSRDRAVILPSRQVAEMVIRSHGYEPSEARDA